MKICSSLAGLALVMVGGLALAAPNENAAPVAQAKAKTYIVQMRGDPVVAYDGGVQDLAATKPAKGKKINPHSKPVKDYVNYLDRQHERAIQEIGAARSKIYDYRYSFNGFAAVLTKAEAEALKNRSDVVAVWEDEILQLQTDNSPDFIGLTEGGDPWSKGYTGEDVIIGMVDTGIWPEHPSVADVPTPKKGNKGPLVPYGPPPASWHGDEFPDHCQFGNSAFNPADAEFACNNKVLAARFYRDGFAAGEVCGEPGMECGWTEFLSARDNDGHGTHTATTAAGNNGVPASIDGEFLGNVSGIAPRARLSIYKVCWNGSLQTTVPRGCASSDSMAAIDQAVADGVDVLNFSIGGPSTTFNGADDIAFLFAADAGVHVAVSAGNDGPGAQTIGTPSGVPWVTASAAAQDDQVFALAVNVTAPAAVAGNKEALEGAGPVTLADTGTIVDELVVGAPANGCAPLTNPDAVNGNTVLIIRGVCAFLDKYTNAQNAGANAIIVYNDGAAPDRFDPIVMGGLDDTVTIPGVMIGHADGVDLAAASGVEVALDPNNLISKANTIAGFSSRGPNGGAPDILKPDVAAPGVNILAGHTPVPNDFGTPGRLFRSISGTSMASPHTAGTLALLDQAHPDWTPAMAKSALMTTARQNLNKTFGTDAANAFDIGAGFIQPGEAFDPGLVYDAGLADYVRFLCGSDTQPQIFSPATCDAFGSIDSSDLNLASIAIAELVGSQTITRTVTNVGEGNKVYRAEVEAPPGINVSVSPSTIHIKTGDSASFEVTFSTTDAAAVGEWAFGSLSWTHGDQRVRSPIAVRPVALSAPDEVRAAGTDGTASFDVSFGYTGPFAVNVDGLQPGNAALGPVADGGLNQHNFIVPPGASLARFSIFDEDVGDGDGSDDLDMQVFFFNPASGFQFLGQSATATSEEEFNVVNPTPGFYAVLVIDFDSAPGPTDYTLFNFNLTGTDAGNTTVTAPAATIGQTGTVTVDWNGLAPGTRYLGFLNHNNGSEAIGRTELLIDTR
ncbi:MAG TPA: S8 family serine peptidase [Woeseiaceae bacterium]|nr:S8 family serine peptidase [Woeseiaceae bacterium]